MTAPWTPNYRTDRWQGRTSDYCVIVPVINEGERIANLLRRMKAVSVADWADVLIIDGGSTDGSLHPAILDQGQVRALLVKTGPGRLSAQLQCAYGFALEQGYAGMITIDGNDKDDPDAIPDFVQSLRDGFDFVQGSRFIPGGISENAPLSRLLAIRLVHAPLLSLFSGFHWTDTTQGFRAYSRRLLEDPRVDPFRKVFNTYELLAYLSYRAPKLGFRCLELPTARRYPASGKVPTKISPFRGQIELLSILIKSCLGAYDPPRRAS